MKSSAYTPFVVAILTTCLSAVAARGAPGPSEAHAYNLLVGTYTEGGASSHKSKGIYTFRFDTDTSRTQWIAIEKNVRNPSWLVVSKDAKQVYCVNELNGTGKSGEVSAYSFDAPTGTLRFINKVSSFGDDPCHLLLDEESKLLFVSNYTAGGMTALGVRTDGSHDVTDFRDTKTPSSALPRAEPAGGSHMHSVAKPEGRAFITVQDLGKDEISVIPYAAGLAKGKAETVVAGKVRLPDKTGPRHMIFDAKAKYAYLIGELNDSVTVFYYGYSGEFTAIQNLPLGDAVVPGKGTAAAIHLSEDGRFLYASVRNPKNIIVVFEVNPENGRLTEIETIASGGKAPREFTISPGGRFLLVANQQSDSIAVFSRNPSTGKIFDTRRRINVGTPVDLKWTPIE